MGRFVDYPLFRVIFRFSVPIGHDRSDTLAVFRFGLPHCTDFLRGLRRIPFVENIVEGHHLHAVAGQSVHTLLYGDKADAEGRVHHLRNPVKSAFGSLWNWIPRLYYHRQPTAYNTKL